VEVLPAQTKTARCAWSEIFHHHVGARGELADDLLAGWLLQVDGDRSLAGVHGDERRAHFPAWHSGELSEVVAHAWPLNLDDVCPEQLQMVGAEGSGERVCQVEHADFFKRLHVDKVIEKAGKARWS